MFEVHDLIFNRRIGHLQWAVSPMPDYNCADALKWVVRGFSMPRHAPVFISELWSGNRVIVRYEKPRALQRYYDEGIIPEK